MERRFYNIGDVAEMLGENISLVRYWSNTFSQFIKPFRNLKGNRLFTPSDIEVLKQIHHLVKVEGMTLQGVRKKMREDRRAVQSKVKAVDKLKEIRSQLEEIRAGLDS